MLEANGLIKKFGQLTALDSVSIGVNEGEFRSIIGPNGAGKTTFLNIISGITISDGGQITFAEEDITDLPPYQITRLGCSRSFQLTNIFPELTVRENVRLVTQTNYNYRYLFRSKEHLTKSIDQAEEILKRFQIYEKRDMKAKNISHGEKWILEVCIALASEPKCLLLDEPTAGLSAEQTNKMLNLIRELKTDYTIVLVEHDMNIVMELSDSITVLHNGRRLMTGPKEEVRSNDDVQSVYLEGGIEND